ncbi:MAG: periplasmic heavy metal sensor [Proteobacteria bacterium]|nr:periplasmic heavy metal sensor [Pseudomonadota bacterium]
MKSPWRTFLTMLLVTVVAAGVASWAGVRYGLSHAPEEVDLDVAVHRDLNLTSDQDRQIHALETAFAAQRADLQAEMRAANKDLAQAITRHHAYDADAQQAVGRLHAAMSRLQEKTIEHVLAIRALLTPSQALEFDRKVAKALGFEPS